MFWLTRFTQIRVLHILILHQFPAGALQDDFAGFKHIAPVGKCERLFCILLHKQNGRTALPQLCNAGEYFFSYDNVDPDYPFEAYI